MLLNLEEIWLNKSSYWIWKRRGQIKEVIEPEKHLVKQKTRLNLKKIQLKMLLD